MFHGAGSCSNMHPKNEPVVLVFLFPLHGAYGILWKHTGQRRITWGSNAASTGYQKAEAKSPYRCRIQKSSRVPRQRWSYPLVISHVIPFCSFTTAIQNKNALQVHHTYIYIYLYTHIYFYIIYQWAIFMCFQTAIRNLMKFHQWQMGSSQLQPSDVGTVDVHVWKSFRYLSGWKNISKRGTTQ